MIGGAGVHNAGEPPFEIRGFFLENFVNALGLLITTLSFGQYLGQDTCIIISYVSSPGKRRSEATYLLVFPLCLKRMPFLVEKYGEIGTLHNFVLNDVFNYYDSDELSTKEKPLRIDRICHNNQNAALYVYKI